MKKFATLVGLFLLSITMIYTQRSALAELNSTSAIALRNSTFLRVQDVNFEIDTVGTVEMWLRTTTVGTDETLFILNGQFNQFFHLRTVPSAQAGEVLVRFQVRDGDLDIVSAASSSPINDGRWHHVAGVFNNQEVSLYVDGQLISSASSAEIGDLDAGHDMSVGYWVWHGMVDMEADEIRVWNTARTAAEIANNRFGSVAPNAAGLVGYWPLDEQSGTTFADVSGNGNDGEFVDFGGNSPRWIGRAWPGGDATFGSDLTNGLAVDASGFIQENGDDVTTIPSLATFGTSSSNLPAGVLSRWAQEWFVTAEDLVPFGRGGSPISMTFDISDAGGSGEFDPTNDYSLLARELSTQPFAKVPLISSSVDGDRLTFVVDSSNLGPTMQRMTIGTDMDMLAVEVSSIEASSRVSLQILMTLMTFALLLTVTGLVFGRINPDKQKTL